MPCHATAILQSGFDRRHVKYFAEEFGQRHGRACERFVRYFSLLSFRIFYHVGLVHADTSRRLSADLRDMKRDVGSEFRNIGREIRDIHREIGQRFRSSSLQNVPRIEIPRIGLSGFGDVSPRYTSTEDAILPPGTRFIP